MRVHTMLIALLVLSCAETPSDSVDSATRSIVGDTILVHSHKTFEPVRIDSLRIVWQSDQLGNPSRMELVGRHLAVADGSRLHLIDLDNGEVATVGRSGDGPGEYRMIWAIGAFPGDSIGVFDPSLRRLSILTPDGAYVHSTRVSFQPPFVDIRQYNNVLLPAGAGVIMLLETNMDSRVEPSSRAALTWIDPEADTSVVLRALDDHSFMSVQGTRYLIPRATFPYSRVIAVSRKGVIAHGSGLGYCVLVEPIFMIQSAPEKHSKVCRDWQRSAIGPGILNPDLSGMADEEGLRRGIREQRIPDAMPSYDLIAFDTLGRLWVRTVGAELANVHPTVLRWFPDRGPEYRRWDVFGTDYELLATLELPNRFEPQVITADKAYGRYSLPSGELVIAEIAFLLLRDET